MADWGRRPEQGHRVVTLDEVRDIALALPGAYEQPSHDARPSWRTKPRMFATVRDDPRALVVWVASVEEKEALLAAEPDKFTTTPHYDGHPIVLVDLEEVDRAEVTELLTDAWRSRAPRRLVTAWEAADPRASRGRDGPARS